jgi:glycosyltransferase involved in cell wall biosynthesis
MIRLFINGLAASAGGGLTYLRNVIPHLARRSDAETTILLNPAMRREFKDLGNISLIEDDAVLAAGRRFIHEQKRLPKLIRRSGAQVLISAGNFALWRSPIPQILLSRNALYTSSDFFRDVRARGDYAIWADTMIRGWLARRSISRAEITVAPSEAFAQELSLWSGRKVRALHHGFDGDAFTGDPTPLSAAVHDQLERGEDALRLLFVSHYNYYRNFETLLRAMPIVRGRLGQERQGGGKVKLYLTCQLKSAENPGAYRAEAAASLADQHRGGHDNENDNDIVELGPVPYRSLHHLYRACHIYVTPAYAESFAHPLIEAMSSGLPVVASDLPVHAEICGGAAVYFPRFSPEALAEQILQLHRSTELREKLSQNGLRRARDFSWSKHVERLVSLAQELVQPETEKR